MRTESRGTTIFSAALGFLKPHPTVRRGYTARKSTTTNGAVHNLYGAASVSCGDRACEAAQQIETRRFLTREVPSIPLPDCTSSTCSCRYVRHRDRRGCFEDRRTPFRSTFVVHEFSGEQEQRKRLCRRATDVEEWV